MKQRAIVLVIGVLVVIGFVTAGVLYKNTAEPPKPEAKKFVSLANSLVRPHSPVIGPVNAPVTIVEFLDPSCESCRAFYPIVKQIMADYPRDVRLVVRYALFHRGSEETARILELARKQGVYAPVLAAIFDSQPQWHDDPQVQAAWKAAGAAGLNIKKARAQMMAPEVTEVLNQDMTDVRAIGVTQTPTFFVNGMPLPSFGAQQLRDLVRSEVNQAR